MGNIRQARDIPDFSKHSRKNYIVDGNFDVWLEGITQSTSGYGSDTMWHNRNSISTKVHSMQAFTNGQTLVPGNPKYFSRTVVTSVANAVAEVRKIHQVEGVHSLSGKTVTLSFWFNTDAPRNIAVEFAQYFGTGGSPSVDVLGITSKIAVTPGWKKYTFTVALPSITGKTIGTDRNDTIFLSFWYDAGSGFDSRTDSLGQQSGTFDIAQVQLEEGPVATEFEIMSIAETLNLVWRYYEKGTFKGTGCTYVPTFAVGGSVKFMASKRTTPVIVLAAMDYTGITGSIGAVFGNYANNYSFTPIINMTGSTAGAGFHFQFNWTADARF